MNVLQVLDAAAAATVLAAFASDRAAPGFSGLLVDFEHKSETDDEDTRAAMWIEDMQVREGADLWIKGRLTTSGTTAIGGGDYRHISPVFEYPIRNYSTGERVRPARLRSAGLTNRPRIKGMVPLSNRDTAPASAAAEKPNSKPEIRNQKMNPEVLTLLGLAPDASPEAVVAAIRALKEKSDQLVPVTQQRDTLLGAAVERDLDDAGLQGATRAPWKTALTTNREATLPLLASVKAAAKPAASGDTAYRVTHNRATATAPDAAAPDAAEETPAAKARGAKISNRATELRKANPRLSRSQAFAKAETEIGA
ncbi:MAG: hypothetical protein IPL39_14480 [Opitutaceae bacterium]|nr:hypothetical protein [Opitutaceae bacterium]